jgi:hypothetical protein
MVKHKLLLAASVALMACGTTAITISADMPGRWQDKGGTDIFPNSRIEVMCDTETNMLIYTVAGGVGEGIAIVPYSPTPGGPANCGDLKK